MENHDPILLPQTRACFAYSTFEEIRRSNPLHPTGASHQDVFGDFAIALRAEARIDLDTIPVSYYYYDFKGKKSENDVPYPLTCSLTHSLLEMRDLLSTLTLLEEKAVEFSGETSEEYESDRKYFHTGPLNLVAQSEERANQSRASLRETDAYEIERILGSLDLDRRPLFHLVQSIDLACALLQTTDSRSWNAEMAYYAQQEWRVIKVVNDATAGMSLAHDDEEIDGDIAEFRRLARGRVCSIAQLMGEIPDESWFERTWLLAGSARSGRPFLSFIEAVVCPTSCKGKVQDMLQERIEDDALIPEIFTN